MPLPCVSSQLALRCPFPGDNDDHQEWARLLSPINVLNAL